MSQDLEAELLKALMVTYATALIVAPGAESLSDDQLVARIQAVKDRLS